MPDYTIRTTATDTGRQHSIRTESKQNALRYFAMFQASPDWKDSVIVVNGKEYYGPGIRDKLP